MTGTLRRFLVVQAFMLWQGGFVFYAAVVVPAGTDIHGEFAQGMVTQRVTDWLNVFGLAWHLLFAWDVWATEGRRSWRGGLWYFSFVLLGVLALLHLKLDRMVAADEVHDSASMFYRWHAAYLFISTVQWAMALVQVWLTLRAWRIPPPGPLPDAVRGSRGFPPSPLEGEGRPDSSGRGEGFSNRPSPLTPRLAPLDATLSLKGRGWEKKTLSASERVVRAANRVRSLGRSKLPAAEPRRL